MLEEVVKVITVVLSSCLKFVLGPGLGYKLKLHPLITAISTILGMMISVTGFTYFGDWLKRRFFRGYFDPPANPSRLRRKFLVLMRKYGLSGIAFFTPLILTPIGGTILAVSTGKPREKILFYMFVSAVFWSALLTLVVYSFGHAVLPNFMK